MMFMMAEVEEALVPDAVCLIAKRHVPSGLDFATKGGKRSSAVCTRILESMSVAIEVVASVQQVLTGNLVSLVPRLGASSEGITLPNDDIHAVALNVQVSSSLIQPMSQDVILLNPMTLCSVLAMLPVTMAAKLLLVLVHPMSFRGVVALLPHMVQVPLLVKAASQLLLRGYIAMLPVTMAAKLLLVLVHPVTLRCVVALLPHMVQVPLLLVATGPLLLGASIAMLPMTMAPKLMTPALMLITIAYLQLL
jgi:hypothetical protein